MVVSINCRLKIFHKSLLNYYFCFIYFQTKSGIITIAFMKKVLFLIYEIIIFLPVLIVVSILTAIIVMIGVTVGDKLFWSYYPPKYWSRIVCRVALCRINVVRKGALDPKQSYVFVANHQSAFDIFLIYGYLGQNIKWVQKKELRKLPFVGKASEMAGHVFVDQSSFKSMKETIHHAAREIVDGTSMTIFPEGSRTSDGKMTKFKRGAFVIAKELGLPVVPLTINGAFDVMKIHTYLINPGVLELVVHEPITTKGLKDEEIPEFMNKCRDVVHSELWGKYK